VANAGPKVQGEEAVPEFRSASAFGRGIVRSSEGRQPMGRAQSFGSCCARGRAHSASAGLRVFRLIPGHMSSSGYTLGVAFLVEKIQAGLGPAVKVRGRSEIRNLKTDETEGGQGRRLPLFPERRLALHSNVREHSHIERRRAALRAVVRGTCRNISL